jgi:hypothetical protein
VVYSACHEKEIPKNRAGSGPFRTCFSAAAAGVAGMKIRVSCYAGYRSEEAPRSLTLGDTRISVIEILDRWIAPDHRYFKLRGDDDAVYIVRHDVEGDQWELTYYRSA